MEKRPITTMATIREIWRHLFFFFCWINDLDRLREKSTISRLSSREEHFDPSFSVSIIGLRVAGRGMLNSGNLECSLSASESFTSIQSLDTKREAEAGTMLSCWNLVRLSLGGDGY